MRHKKEGLDRRNPHKMKLLMTIGGTYFISIDQLTNRDFKQSNFKVNPHFVAYKIRTLLLNYKPSNETKSYTSN